MRIMVSARKPKRLPMVANKGNKQGRLSTPRSCYHAHYASLFCFGREGDWIQITPPHLFESGPDSNCTFSETGFNPLPLNPDPTQWKKTDSNCAASPESVKILDSNIPPPPCEGQPAFSPGDRQNSFELPSPRAIPRTDVTSACAADARVAPVSTYGSTAGGIW